MHPDMQKLMTDLGGRWYDCLKRARTLGFQKESDRAPQYDQVSPVWMRLTDPQQYVTMLMIKAERVRSELASTKLEDWDPDNAVDLIVYTTFLVAYKMFCDKRITEEGAGEEELHSPECTCGHLRMDHKKDDVCMWASKCRCVGFEGVTENERNKNRDKSGGG